MKLPRLIVIYAMLSTAISLSLRGRIRREDNTEYEIDKGEEDTEYSEYEYEEYDYDIEYETLFPCSTGDEAVSLFSLCDGFRDCQDGSDEILTNCEAYKVSTTATTTSTTTTTTAKPDIDPNVVDFDQYDDACATGEFQCLSDMSICLPNTHVCDGIDDCPSKEDEADCFDAGETTSRNEVTSSRKNASSSHVFQCRSRPGDYVPRRLLCDGYRDCPDGSDEERCACKVGEYKCINSHCIDASLRCDGKDDCGDFSDEIIGCMLHTAFLPANGDNLSEKAKKPTSSDESDNGLVDNRTVSDSTETVDEDGDEKTTSEDTSTEEAVTEYSKSELKANSQETISLVIPIITPSASVIYGQFCRLSPCANGGECFENNRSFNCVCKPHFMGPTCLQRVRSDPGNSSESSFSISRCFTVAVLLIAICIIYFVS